MKYRFSYVLIIAAAVGFMLWGCSSETQDPVSSINTSSGGAVKVLHKTISAPANVLAVVNGSTVTISWDSVALAINYHVVVQVNGTTDIDSILSPRQLVLAKMPAGNYTVTVAAIQASLPEGTASVPISFTVLSSVLPPTVTVTASPIPSWFRNEEWVTVAFSGLVVNSEGGASYELKDEYNMVHYAGTVPAGPYVVKLKLKDRSIWFDRNGRQYTFTISAANSAGTAKASVTVTVPRDRNFPNRRDDDHWDDNR